MPNQPAAPAQAELDAEPILERVEGAARAIIPRRGEASDRGGQRWCTG
jgi:hypothetical protein